MAIGRGEGNSSTSPRLAHRRVRSGAPENVGVRGHQSAPESARPGGRAGSFFLESLRPAVLSRGDGKSTGLGVGRASVEPEYACFASSPASGLDDLWILDMKDTKARDSRW